MASPVGVCSPSYSKKKRLDWLLEGGKERRALVFTDTHTPWPICLEAL